MFSHITQNWRGRPLETLETVVNLIGATTTQQGLRIRAAADLKQYDKGIDVGEDEMAAITIQPHRTRVQWNYKIVPRL